MKENSKLTWGQKNTINNELKNTTGEFVEAVDANILHLEGYYTIDELKIFISVMEKEGEK
jgi:hypothetical protein